jgi:hypothetical protein
MSALKQMNHGLAQHTRSGAASETNCLPSELALPAVCWNAVQLWPEMSRLVLRREVGAEFATGKETPRSEKTLENRAK